MREKGKVSIVMSEGYRITSGKIVGNINPSSMTSYNRARESLNSIMVGSTWRQSSKHSEFFMSNIFEFDNDVA